MKTKTEIKQTAAEKAESWRAVDAPPWDRPMSPENLDACEAVAKKFDKAAQSGLLEDLESANEAAKELQKP